MEHAPVPGLWVAFAGALGLIVGSFLNVVVHRWPRGESIVHPRSRCPRCGRTIRALENVPLLSYLWLRGRCRGCGTRIPWRYPLLEAGTGAVFAGIAAVHGPTPLLPLWLAFAAALIAAAMIDLDHQIIPDEISLGGLALGLVAVPAVRAWSGAAAYPAALGESLAGAALGGGVLWLAGFVHARVSVALGREFAHWPAEGEAPPRPGSLDYWTWFPGLGFGDVKLLAMIGAFVGPVLVLETVLAAALLGLVVGLAVGLARRSLAQPFGFGPAIALGAILVLATPVHPF